MRPSNFRFQKLIVLAVVMPAFVGIRIWGFLASGYIQPIECSLCQTCITVCAREALKLSFGFDMGGRELLREHETGV